VRSAGTLTQALTDPKLFGGTFRGPSFWTRRVVAKLIDGLPLTEQRELDLFRECTGLEPTREAAMAAFVKSWQA
jgi:hypothetical protein